jgi:hypothetical protein
MGAPTANVSRNIYDERKQYVKLRAQPAVPGVDADFNDFYDSVFNQMRRIQQLIGDGSANDGFKVVGNSSNNSFTIKGGDSSAEGSGRLFVSGHCCMLDRDITYVGVPLVGIDGQAQRSILPKITAFSYNGGLNQTTIEDSSANYISNELVGRTITPDVEGGSSAYSILSNTQTQIIVSGDLTTILSEGNRYRLNLTTPTSNRTDYVYLNVFLDEIDGDEDPELKHSFLTVQEAQRRWQVQQYVFVRQGSASPFSGYVDTDGLRHFTSLIATINRVSGDSTISSGMVIDNRNVITPLAGQQISKHPLTVTANGQTTFILPETPTYPTRVFMDVSGLDQEYGTTKDFYVTGNQLIWNNRQFQLDMDDVVYVWFLQ